MRESSRTEPWRMGEPRDGDGRTGTHPPRGGCWGTGTHTSGDQAVRSPLLTMGIKVVKGQL